MKEDVFTLEEGQVVLQYPESLSQDSVSFATALRAYLAANPKNRYLFQTRLAGPFTTRRVEQIVKRYAEAAGVKATSGP